MGEVMSRLVLAQRYCVVCHDEHSEQEAQGMAQLELKLALGGRGTISGPGPS